MHYSSQLLVAATTCLAFASAARPGPNVKRPVKDNFMPELFTKRQLPALPQGVQTIISPSGVNITYKNPGAEGVCETTPGSYSMGDINTIS